MLRLKHKVGLVARLDVQGLSGVPDRSMTGKLQQWYAEAGSQSAAKMSKSGYRSQ